MLNSLPRRSVLMAILIMLMATIWAERLKPTEISPYIERDFRLEDIVPTSLPGWRSARQRAVVQPLAEERPTRSIYDQELTRIYRNEEGDILMLVIAFGHDQSDAFQLHRPEVCYRAINLINFENDL